jgi:ferredoxin
MKIAVDQHKCVGAGNCVLSAPLVFDQRESDGIVVLLQALPDAAQEDAVRKAARLCPSGAIRIARDQAERTLPGR